MGSEESAATTREQVMAVAQKAQSRRIVLTAFTGAREHVRLSGQDYPARAKRVGKVSRRVMLAILGHREPVMLNCSPRSCLLHRFVKNEWRILSSQTIGVEFASKIIKVGTGARRKRIKLQVGTTLVEQNVYRAGILT